MRYMKVHNFKDSRIIGDLGERVVKDYLESIDYLVIPLSVKEQLKHGYDFRARNLATDKVFGIEVKTDIASNTTGNLFIETSVNGKYGWIMKYKPSSKVIFVFVLNLCTDLVNRYKLLFVPVTKLQSFDYQKYPYKVVKNKEYLASGYVVPVSEIKKLGVVKTIEL